MSSPEIDSLSANLDSLSEKFDRSLKIRDELEVTNLPSSSDEYQDMVIKGIKLLEDATHMVNAIGLFSTNETVEEVATSDLKYFLLPALLGSFNLKHRYISSASRLEKLKLSEMYFQDFLKRCKNYEISNVSIPDISTEEEDEGNEHKENPELLVDLNQMAVKRNAVVNRYKETKELEERLGNLKNATEDETKREYYLLLLKKWILNALEELHSIEMEKSVLANMVKEQRNSKMEKKGQKSKPLKPVIIVKTELQKKVFGLGYPSLPTMTVDEFYQQRYPEREGESSAAEYVNSMQQMAMDPDATKRRYEAEDVEKEELLEKDDPVALQKVRAFDDWKDENRRGSGNRQNKG